MLEVYFDESGTHEETSTSFLLLAGYTTDPERWQTFGSAWKVVLKEFRLQQFHMKDIRNFRAPSLKHLDAVDRRALLTALINLVADTAVLGTLVYLRPTDYTAVTDPATRPQVCR